MPGVIHVNDVEFEELVVNATGGVVANFYADWCIPCRTLLPLIEEVANEDSDIRFVKLNVDDYPHHPTELEATLAAVRAAWPGRRLVAVLQPHRFSRTRDLLDDFATAFNASHHLWLHNC